MAKESEKVCLRKAQTQLEKHQLGFDGENIGLETLKKKGYKKPRGTSHKHHFDLLTDREAWEVKTVSKGAPQQMWIKHNQKVEKLKWAKENHKQPMSMMVIVDGEAEVRVKKGLGMFRPKAMKRIAKYKNWREEIGHGRAERLVTD